tara:strand:+ start:5930 stop:6481 length:552 start_codon:yes stop_codon:yes gene_type:complete
LKFNVIVVDPPWQQGKTGRRSSRPNQEATLSYNSMPMTDIAKLPIQSISMEQSVCFLWTTQKFLRHSYAIVEDWGFTPRWTLTWDKGNGMTLQGFHLRTEFIIFSSRGYLPTFLAGKAMPTLITEHTSRQHSIKPDRFYELAAMFGDYRVDIFARQYREDWYCIGNELTGNDIRKDLEETVKL